MDRWKKWALTEKETKVIEAADDNVFFSAEDIDLCLVAKVITSKQVNCDAFRSVMKGAWRVHQGTRIELAGINIFFIHFRSGMERLRVMNSGP